MNTIKENNAIGIKITGKGIYPNTIKLKELSELLGNIETLLYNVIVNENPKIKTDEIVIGLENIEEGSLKLHLSSTFKQLTLLALNIISESVSKNNYDKLPKDSLTALKNISYFSQRRKCNIEFRTDMKSKLPSAMITPDSSIKTLEPTIITGETTIFGKIEKIGGVTPAVTLRLADNSKISSKLSKEQAVELSSKLYSWVSLYGKAYWDIKDNSVQAFDIIRIENYDHKPIDSAVKNLSDKYGHYFDDIPDVIKYVEDIREGE